MIFDKYNLIVMGYIIGGAAGIMAFVWAIEKLPTKILSPMVLLFILSFCSANIADTMREADRLKTQPGDQK